MDLSKLDPWRFSMDVMVGTKMTEGRLGIRKARHDLDFLWEHAFEHAVYEFDMQWSRLIDFNGKTLAGVRWGNSLASTIDFIWAITNACLFSVRVPQLWIMRRN